jgi:hypothetical protein
MASSPNSNARKPAQIPTIITSQQYLRGPEVPPSFLSSLSPTQKAAMLQALQEQSVSVLDDLFGTSSYGKKVRQLAVEAQLKTIRGWIESRARAGHFCTSQDQYYPYIHPENEAIFKESELQVVLDTVTTPGLKKYRIYWTATETESNKRKREDNGE